MQASCLDPGIKAILTTSSFSKPHVSLTGSLPDCAAWYMQYLPVSVDGGHPSRAEREHYLSFPEPPCFGHFPQADLVSQPTYLVGEL